MELLQILIHESDCALDVTDAYVELRDSHSVKKTIDILKQKFKSELEDYDDMPVFWVGLAYAMAEKNELNLEVMDTALKLLHEFVDNKRMLRGVSPSKMDLAKIEVFFRGHIGRPKRTAKLKRYVTDWTTGDFYYMPLKTTESEEMGLSGRFLILQTVNTMQLFDDVIPIVHIFLTKDTQKPTGIERVLSCYQIPSATYCNPNKYRFNIGGRKGLNSEAYKTIEFLGHFDDYPAIKETKNRDEQYNLYAGWEGIESLMLLRLKSLKELGIYDYSI